MWIQIHNEATERLYNADLMDEPVSFSETGLAQVPADVGAQLIDHYDAISEHEPDDA